MVKDRIGQKWENDGPLVGKKCVNGGGKGEEWPSENGIHRNRKRAIKRTQREKWHRGGKERAGTKLSLSRTKIHVIRRRLG